MKNFLRFLFIILFLIAGIFVIFHPAKTETNILNAVFSNSQKDKIVVDLSGRYSSIINVMVEGEDVEKVGEISEKFSQKINQNFFTKKDINVQKFLEKYKKYQNNLLSVKNINLLEKEQYEEVASESLEALYNPLGFSLVPLEEDPFMLFTDYVKSLSTNSNGDFSLINYNDKYYSITTLEINHDNALSPSVANKEIKNLIKIQKELSSKDAKIYLTGSPVHSYYASSRSMFEINLICFFSVLFLLALFKYYFTNIKLVIPAIITLGFGMLCGYIIASIFFKSIHVLTFVFSTTLIGICIDYTLHYFIEKDINKIFKSLTVSMFTTVSAFAVLMLSGVELLKQISVFTMTGLFSVYCIVNLFYPLLKFDVDSKNINFEMPQKMRKILIFIVAIFAFCGLFFVKFNDDIRAMYVPSKNLLKAEKLFKEVTGSGEKTTFAVVKGNDLQTLLENEERLTHNLNDSEFQAMSKYIPSKKQQKENQILRKNLYKNSLKNYATFLSQNQVENLLNSKISEDYLSVDENDILSEFLLDKNTSLVVLYDIKNPEIVEKNGADYIDIQKNISDRIQKCRNNCLVMLLPILAVLLIILSCIYKFKTAVKILTPSLLASTFSVGILSLCGVEINLFHVLAIFLIIGFGLDYSVFRASGLKGSKDAVFFSCLTTIFSFLLLAFTGFKLISSLGIILTIGLAISYLTSLVFEYKNEEKFS